MSALMTILIALMHLVTLIISAVFLACSAVGLMLFIRFGYVTLRRLLKKKDQR